MVYYSKSHRLTRWDIFMGKAVRLKIIFFFFLAVCGLAYFWQINILSIRGFKIEELGKAIQMLKTDSQKLELEMTAAQAMLNLDEQIKKLNLVSVSQIEYLRPVGPAVAVR